MQTVNIVFWEEDGGWLGYLRSIESKPLLSRVPAVPKFSAIVQARIGKAYG
jgi:hypothetical protein